MVTPKGPTSRRMACRDCKRQIELLPLDDGTMLRLDTEVVSVVLYPDGGEIVNARRLHAGLCRPMNRRPEEAFKARVMDELSGPPRAAAAARRRR